MGELVTFLISLYRSHRVNVNLAVDCRPECEEDHTMSKITASHDDPDRRDAEHQAATIQRYYHRRGQKSVRCWVVETSLMVSQSHKARWEVRSNITFDPRTALHGRN